jgi:ribosomal protein RSM22 (predicted rRNA methylase)
MSFSDEISTLKDKLRSLEETLKEQIHLQKDLEKEKIALVNTNEQIILDYKYDLEAIKKNVKSKAIEDEILFKRVVDEKGMFVSFYVK